MVQKTEVSTRWGYLEEQRVCELSVDGCRLWRVGVFENLALETVELVLAPSEEEARRIMQDVWTFYELIIEPAQVREVRRGGRT